MAIIKPRRGTGYPSSGLTLGELAVDTTNRVVYMGSTSGTGITVASLDASTVRVLSTGANGDFSVAMVNTSGSQSAIVRETASFTYNPGSDTLSMPGFTLTHLSSSRITSSSNSSGGNKNLTIEPFGNVVIAPKTAGTILSGPVSLTVSNSDGSVTVTGGNLVLGQVTTLLDGITYPSVLQFKPGTSSTTLSIEEPTAFNTILLPNDSGTVALTKNVVSGVCGATGAVSIVAGSAVSIVRNGTQFTITNTGVTGASAGLGISVSPAGGTGRITITNTGVTEAIAGSGISVDNTTGRVTITNTGVLSAVAGTNITISPASGTGNVTIGVTNAPTFSGLVTANSLFVQTNATVGGNLGVTGNANVNGNLGVTGAATIQGAITGNSTLTIASTGLIGSDFTVNGVNTIINSTNVRIADPVVTIGWTADAPPLCGNNDNKDRGLNFWWTTGCTETLFTTEVVRWEERPRGTSIQAIIPGITEIYIGPKQGYFGFNRAYKTFIALEEANINGTGAGGSGAGGSERFSGKLASGWFDYILLGTGGSGEDYDYSREPRCLLRPPPVDGRSFSIYTLPFVGGTLAHWNLGPTYAPSQDGLVLTSIFVTPPGGPANSWMGFGWKGVAGILGEDGGGQDKLLGYSGGSAAWIDTATWLSDLQDKSAIVFSSNTNRLTTGKRTSFNQIELTPVIGSIAASNQGLVDGNLAFTYIRDNTVASVNGQTGAVTNLCATRVDATGTNTDAQFYPLFAAGTGCTLVSLDPDASHFRYNPSTGVLTTLGISTSGLTLTGNFSASNIVNSFNGSTGAVQGVSRVIVQSGGGVDAVTGAFGLSAGNNITFSVSGQTLTISSAGGSGSSPAGANGYVQYFKNGAFAGDADLQFNEATNVLSVAGLSAGGATFTGNISAPNIVTSVNGSTGAVTNVARINEGNTFTVRQVMNAGATMTSLFVGSGSTFGDRIIVTAGGLSASHTTDTVQITSTTTGSVGLIVANSTNPSSSDSRNGRIQLGRSSTSGWNSTLQNSQTNFTVYKGNSAGTVVFDYTSGGITLSDRAALTSSLARITSSTLAVASPVASANAVSSIRLDAFDISDNYSTATLQPNVSQLDSTTHTLPAVSGTLLNNNTGVASVNGSIGAVTITGISAANTNASATFYPVFVDRSGGLTAVYVDAVTTPLTYIPNTGLISARTFLGTNVNTNSSVWLAPSTGGAPEVFIADTSATNLNLRGTLRNDGGSLGVDIFAGFVLGGASSAGVPLTIASTGGIRFAGLRSTADDPAWQYLFPTGSGLSGQVLTTNGGATLSWGNAVSGICGATGAVTLSAGSNITITRTDSTFTIASTASGGGSAVEGGTGISVQQSGNTATVTNEGVNTYDGLTGNVVTPPLLLYNLGII